MNDKYVAVPREDWEDILDSVRGKTGKTALLKSGDVPAEIDGIQQGEDLTSELSAQKTLISDIKTALAGKAAGGGGADNSALIGLIDGTIKDVVVPAEITKLRDGAFAYTDITSLTIPDHVTSVGGQIAYLCRKLKRVSVGGNVDFGDTVQQFGNCTDLAEVVLSEGVTKITNNMFAACSALASIVIPSSVTSIGSNAFTGTAFTNFVVPDSIREIGTGGIYNMAKLTSVTLGRGLETMGNNMFSLCKALVRITCYATTPPTLGSSPFGSVPSNCAIYVPAESVDAYKAATNWSSKAALIQAIS